MGVIDIDPSLQLAHLILLFTLFIALIMLLEQTFKSLFHWRRRGRYSSGDRERQKHFAVDTDRQTETMTQPFGIRKLLNVLMPLFRYVLFLVFVLVVIRVLADDYKAFQQPIERFDVYISVLGQLLVFQLWICSVATLFWFYANSGLRRLILWGMLIVSADVLFETGLQWYRYDYFHWLQRAELGLTGLALLLIPMMSSAIFFYVNNRVQAERF